VTTKIGEMPAEDKIFLLRKAAAHLHFHDIREIKLSEEDFVLLLMEGHITYRDNDWHFFGLKVIRHGKGLSSGN